MFEEYDRVTNVEIKHSCGCLEEHTVNRQPGFDQILNELAAKPCSICENIISGNNLIFIGDGVNSSILDSIKATALKSGRHDEIILFNPGNPEKSAKIAPFANVFMPSEMLIHCLATLGCYDFATHRTLEALVSNVITPDNELCTEMLQKYLSIAKTGEYPQIDFDSLKAAVSNMLLIEDLGITRRIPDEVSVRLYNNKPFIAIFDYENVSPNKKYASIMAADTFLCSIATALSRIYFARSNNNVMEVPLIIQLDRRCGSYYYCQVFATIGRATNTSYRFWQ